VLVSLHERRTGLEDGRFPKLTQLWFSRKLIEYMRDHGVVGLYTPDQFAARTLNLTSISSEQISITGTAQGMVTVMYHLPAGISVNTRMMSPECVRPYVKAQKNDDGDAGAIAEADNAVCRAQE